MIGDLIQLVINHIKLVGGVGGFRLLVKAPNFPSELCLLGPIFSIPGVQFIFLDD